MRGDSILLIIGTRPEAIKLAPVATALARRELPVELLFTGQHPRLDPRHFGLAGFRAQHLHCLSNGDPLAHAADVARAVRASLTPRPSMVVVQGDTSSALGGAEAARDADVPLAHVEAGLRSFDPAMPWPEEDNRVTIDSLADLLFAPTDTSAQNLRREDVRGEIHVTGNTAIDALRLHFGALPLAPLRQRDDFHLLVTCYRRENWEGAFTSIAVALLQLAGEPRVRITVLLHLNPTVADVMRRLLSGNPSIHLIPPVSHAVMLGAMRNASVILSDSGGIQEEAPALGIPLLILREKTERPEALATGSMRLIGTHTETIVTEVRELRDDPVAYAVMARPAFPYGDGFASDRIAAGIEAFLAEHVRAAGTKSAA